jgi:flagellar hook assembly protein FlgD
MGSDTRFKKVIVDTTAPIVTGFTVSPNPFTPPSEMTTISYTLSEPCRVTIKILTKPPWTVQRKLINNVKQTSGVHSILWDGKDTFGTLLPPGTYHLRVLVRDLAKNKATIYPIKTIIEIT